MSTLFLVATPIGNLEDISNRALRILAGVNLIAAEDTRQTRKLLEYYNIQTQATSYFEHNKINKMAQILAALSEGDVALVSDAGTPALNDPGFELVKAAIKAGHIISPIPGPSAPIAALTSSGLPTDAFLYLGYLPRKTNERSNRLEEISGLPYTLIFLETPHRLLASLNDILKSIGNRQLAVARELTKLHEEIFRGSVSDAIEHFTSKGARGEFTIIIEGKKTSKEIWTEDKLHTAIKERMLQGSNPSNLAGELSSESGWPRRAVYKMIIKHQSSE